MSEKSPQKPESVNTEFQEAAQAVRELCDEILDTGGSASGDISTIWSQVEAADVQKQLRTSSLGDLMLVDGWTLSIDGASMQKKAPDTEERLRAMFGDRDLIREINEDSPEENANFMGLPELNLFVSADSLSLAGVRVARYGHTEPEDRLSVLIGHRNDTYEAFQTITAKTGTYSGGREVMLESYVSSPAYDARGQSYNRYYRVGHSSYLLGLDYAGDTTHHKDTPEEVFSLIDLARELIAKPIEEETT